MTLETLEIPKATLWQDFLKIKQWLSEYWSFLEHLPLEVFTDETEIIEFLRKQHQKFLEFQIQYQTLDLLGSLIHLSLNRVKKETLIFELPKQLSVPEDFKEIMKTSNDIRQIEVSLQRLVEQVTYLTHHLPGGENDSKLTHLIKTIGSLFKAIIRQDEADISVEFNQLHLLTATKDSYVIVEEIGKVTREIYNSLQDLSTNLDTAEIQNATDEMPDAVQKLYSVIQRLEEATNDNLDFLENLLERCVELIHSNESMLQDCLKAKEMIIAIEDKHPELKDEFFPLQQIIEENLQTKLEKMLSALHENENSYITIMSNQGFQDLTGQTLKKIIDFMEQLELRLLELIQKYSTQLDIPTEEANKPKKTFEADPLTRIDTGVRGEEIRLHGPDESESQKSTQNEVDSLLAELGF